MYFWRNEVILDVCVLVHWPQLIVVCALTSVCCSCVCMCVHSDCYPSPHYRTILSHNDVHVEYSFKLLILDQMLMQLKLKIKLFTTKCTVHNNYACMNDIVFIIIVQQKIKKSSFSASD